MKFMFTERKINISDAVRAYAEKKLSKLDRYFKNEAEAYVTVGHQNGKVWIEVTVKYDGTLFRASQRGDDLKSLIDIVQVTIDRQIRKNKTRLEKRFREGSIKFDMDSDFDAPAEENFELVRRKKFPIKPMAVEEAILQMNLLNHQFFVFRDMETEAYCVVYKRNDGGYGLIESDDE